MLDGEILPHPDLHWTGKKVGLNLGEAHVQDAAPAVALCVTLGPLEYPGGWAQMPLRGGVGIGGVPARGPGRGCHVERGTQIVRTSDISKMTRNLYCRWNLRNLKLH